ncbi:MAG: inositol monophosphatase [Alphaproteobacteria bacterium]|nr:inositol monophosphatase [Alphaproteobacteria bacterium]
MNDRELVDRFEAAQAIAREAGEIALEYFRKFDDLQVTQKGAQDMASEADVAVEVLIRERLAARFPEDGFYGEESGRSDERGDGERLWVVDPIDGTACFVTGIPVWCVSIAFVVGDDALIGVVYDPNADEMFAARQGSGATLNGQPIRPSDADSFADGMVGVGYSTRTAPAPALEFLAGLLADGGMFIRNGSGALMITYVGAGRLLGYYEAHLNSWDGAAAIAIVREAGGWTNDFLAGDGLTKGNVVAAVAPRLVPAMKRLAGLE